MPKRACKRGSYNCCAFFSAPGGASEANQDTTQVLDAINKGESMTASQIAKRCDLSASFASTLLKGLVTKGYLSRRSDSRSLGGVEFIYCLI
ncbi:helix-turn-helix domain-containing protein [Vibrio furnissii]|uniref:MarR family transcriptional regulator n=1 Tax=Vibrio furnissii TaxID=29494 RepID=UPI0030C7B0B0